MPPADRGADDGSRARSSGTTDAGAGPLEGERAPGGGPGAAAVEMLPGRTRSVGAGQDARVWRGRRLRQRRLQLRRRFPCRNANGVPAIGGRRGRQTRVEGVREGGDEGAGAWGRLSRRRGASKEENRERIPSRAELLIKCARTAAPGRPRSLGGWRLRRCTPAALTGALILASPSMANRQQCSLVRTPCRGPAGALRWFPRSSEPSSAALQPSHPSSPSRLAPRTRSAQGSPSSTIWRQGRFSARAPPDGGAPRPRPRRAALRPGREASTDRRRAPSAPTHLCARRQRRGASSRAEADPEHDARSGPRAAAHLLGAGGGSRPRAPPLHSAPRGPCSRPAAAREFSCGARQQRAPPTRPPAGVLRGPACPLAHTFARRSSGEVSRRS